MLIVAMLSCVFAITCDEGSETAAPTLPRLNYWYLMEQLEHMSSHQASLGVSPSQLAQIKALRVQDKFDNMFDEVLDLRLAEKRVASSDLVWLELDPRIYEELSQILSKDQIFSLRQRVLRQKYLGPLDCFRDAELLAFLDWRSPPDAFSLVLERERSKLELAVQQLKKNCLQEIHATLPPPSSDCLERYCGTFEYSKLNKVVDIDSIPYRFETIFEGVYFESQRATLPDSLALSNNQKSDLKSIFLASGKELPMTASQQERKLANVRSAQEMRQILSREQYAFLVQLAARNQLCRDFRKAFERKEFLDYLELETGDVASVQDAAEKQSRRMSLEMERLSEAAFQNVANHMPVKQREKLLALFNGGWVYKHR